MLHDPTEVEYGVDCAKRGNPNHCTRQGRPHGNEAWDNRSAYKHGTERSGGGEVRGLGILCVQEVPTS